MKLDLRDFTSRSEAPDSGDADRGSQSMLQRLLVVSHVVHYKFEGRLYAYGPYSREIDIWAELFPAVAIAAPLRQGPPPGDCLPFEGRNVSVVPQREAGGHGLAAKLRLGLAIPGMMLDLARAMAGADAIHVRCPGNLGLLGVVLAPLFSRYLVAKYAAQWNGSRDEPFSSRLQRRLLRSFWWRGPVTVYGDWPGQPRNVVPFFTSLLAGEQLERARLSASRARGDRALRVLYTGRLSKAKNVDVLLRAAAAALARGADLSCVIVGEGPERGALEQLSTELGLGNRAEFTGGVPFDRVIGYLEQSDVLVLASETEGWPKSIAEGMAFGLVCIGSDLGFVPRMLGEGRGLVVPPRDAGALTEMLYDIAINRESYQPMREHAAAWARQFSVEGLRSAIRSLLAERWSIPFDGQEMQTGRKPPTPVR